MKLLSGKPQRLQAIIRSPYFAVSKGATMVIQMLKGRYTYIYIVPSGRGGYREVSEGDPAVILVSVLVTRFV